MGNFIPFTKAKIQAIEKERNRPIKWMKYRNNLNHHAPPSSLKHAGRSGTLYPAIFSVKYFYAKHRIVSVVDVVEKDHTGYPSQVSVITVNTQVQKPLQVSVEELKPIKRFRIEKGEIIPL